MGARTGLVLALATAACGAGTSTEPSWSAVRQHEPASLLSVWGASETDVWVVGARATLAGGPTVLHYDGATWTRPDPAQSALDLWIVFGVPGGDVFFGGSDGTILRYRAGAFEKMTTPRTGTIFGMWGTSATDLWAVGDGGAAGGIVWHYDGTAWTEPALPPGVPGRVLKVHGQAANDVWISCADGSALHWQGTAIEREVTTTQAPLFSIVTTPELTVAVGGANGTGVIDERVASVWMPASLQVPAVWRGAAARDGDVFAVGENGVVAHRASTGAWSVIRQPLTSQNFHAAWVDPVGGLWGVGGAFDQLPLTAEGFLLHYGTDAIMPIEP